MSGTTMRWQLSTDKRKVLLLGVLTTLATVLFLVGPLAPARASNEAFCTEVILQADQGCHDQVFRKITRVNAEGREWPVCAGALNGNGVEVGGWVCSPSGVYGHSFASNANYDGTKFYEGRIYNSIGTWDVLWGLEYYNP